MRRVEALADLGRNGHEQDRSDGVADKRSHDQTDTEQGDDDLPQRKLLDDLLDEVIERLEQSRRCDCLAERNTAHGQKDDGPEERVEVLLGEDASAKEEHHGDDGNDAHVADDPLEVLLQTPQHDRRHGDGRDEPLDLGERVPALAELLDHRAPPRTIAPQQDQPDDHQRQAGHGDGDGKPLQPPHGLLHVLQRNQVLRRSDGRGLSADVRRKRNAHDEARGVRRLARQRTQDGLDERIHEHGCSHVADPHGRKARHAHVRQQHHARPRTGQPQDLGGQNLVDAILGQRRSEREAAEQQAHVGRKHLREDPLCGLGRRHAAVLDVVGACDAQRDHEQRHHQRGDEERDHLGRPQDGAEDEHRQTVLLLDAVEEAQTGCLEQRHERGEGDEQMQRAHAQPAGHGEAAARRAQAEGLAGLQIVLLAGTHDGSFERRTLRTPLDADHLAPHGVALPHDLLAQMRLELLRRRAHVAGRDHLGKELDERIDALVEPTLGVGGKGRLGAQAVVHVALLEVGLCDLVVLFEDLAHARLVELDELAQLGHGDKEVGDALLEGDAHVDGVVIVGGPDGHALGVAAKAAVAGAAAAGKHDAERATTHGLLAKDAGPARLGAGLAGVGAAARALGKARGVALLGEIGRVVEEGAGAVAIVGRTRWRPRSSSLVEGGTAVLAGARGPAFAHALLLTRGLVVLARLRKDVVDAGATLGADLGGAYGVDEVLVLVLVVAPGKVGVVVKVLALYALEVVLEVVQVGAQLGVLCEVEVDDLGEFLVEERHKGAVGLCALRILKQAGRFVFDVRVGGVGSGGELLLHEIDGLFERDVLLAVLRDGEEAAGWVTGARSGSAVRLGGRHALRTGSRVTAGLSSWAADWNGHPRASTARDAVVGAKWSEFGEARVEARAALLHF
ncbi:hypothetical protein L1887_62084 [Cichorium endivia]|nr:hypothetical protein L1887_62084 [Cichorium endivia]